MIALGLSILAVYRVSRMLTQDGEDGPFDLLAKWREWIGQKTWIGRGFHCFYCVSFWAALVDLASDGRVVSIDRVKGEIDRGKDDLADWANGSFHDALPRPVIRRCLTRIAT